LRYFCKRSFGTFIFVCFPSFTLAIGPVIITEVGACDSGDSEWVEIWNISDEVVDLHNWKFFEDGVHHRLSGDAVLGPNSGAIIVDKDEEFSAIFPDFSGLILDSSWGSLRNDGEILALKNGEEVIDEITYPSCKKGESLVRNFSSPLQWSWEKIATGTHQGIFDTAVFFLSDEKNSADNTSTPVQTDSGKSENLFGDPINIPDAPKEVQDFSDPEVDSTDTLPEETLRQKITEKNPPFSLRINEVQPFRLKPENEWIELRLRYPDPMVDFSDWTIDNGRTKKDFTRVLSSLTVHGGEWKSGKIFSQNEIVFLVFNPSPIFLSDRGGTITLRDEKGIVRDIFSYDRGKKGKRKTYRYSEVFNRADSGKNFSLLYRNNGDYRFRHSRGMQNFHSPTDNDTFSIHLSEIVPRPTDGSDPYVEIFIADGPKKINLKYTALKINGSTEMWIREDFWVKPGDFLTVRLNGESREDFWEDTSKNLRRIDRKTLSSNEAIFEIYSQYGTASELLQDFLCYTRDGAFSSSQTKRLNRAIFRGQWSGSCFDSTSWKEGSLARFSDTDHQISADFFLSVRDTPAAKNIVPNEKPTARITLDAGEIPIGEAPLTLHLYGEKSTDHDGVSDISTYHWAENGTFFSDKKNPGKKVFSQDGLSTIQLTVTDKLGESDTFSQKISIGPIPKNSFSDLWEAAFWQRRERILDGEEPPDFFSDFVVSASEDFWQLYFEDDFDAVKTEKAVPKKPRKKTITKAESRCFPFSPQQVEKNLGLAFL